MKKTKTVWTVGGIGSPGAHATVFRGKKKITELIFNAEELRKVLRLQAAQRGVKVSQSKLP